MKDSYGREIDYIRISLTESCNLKCIYCLPESFKCQDVNKNGVLTKENIFDIVEIAQKLNIKKVRLTGGEPLLRDDIVEIIKGIKEIGIEKIYITTNGILLFEKLEMLKKAGLTGINISLDSLDQEQFKSITRGGDLGRVLNGLKKALDYNIEVKVNSVIIKGINENAIENLVKLTEKNRIDIRFIELMPIGEGKKFIGASNKAIYRFLENKFEFESGYREVSGVTVYHKLKDFKGRIGFISPINSCFCESCNKIRITSDGIVKRCLNIKGTFNIKECLDKKIEKEKIEKLLKKEIFNKPEHHLFGKENQDEELKNMNKIGG